MNTCAEKQDALVFTNGVGDRLDVVRNCIHYHGVVRRLSHRDLLMSWESREDRISLPVKRRR